MVFASSVVLGADSNVLCNFSFCLIFISIYVTAPLDCNSLVVCSDIDD